MPLNRKKQYWASAAVMAVFPPLLIVIHEMGHFSVARALGYEPELRYAETFIPAIPRVPKSEMILITLAGPMVELVFMAIGIWWLLRNYGEDTRERGVSVWVFTVFGLVGLRWLKVLFDGKLSDEGWLSSVAGFHHLALPAVLLPLAFVSVGVPLCFHRRKGTLLPLATGFCAGVVSAFLWLNVTGPLLLPYPDSAQKVGNRRQGIDAALEAGNLISTRPWIFSQR